MQWERKCEASSLIDEQVVPFKGKSVFRMYDPKKPKKWGYKIFVLSGVDGLIHNLEVYTGKIEPCPGQPDIKASGNIELCLLSSIPRNVWHKIYCDNWFTSVAFHATLGKQGIVYLGTVQSNQPNIQLCVVPWTAPKYSLSGRATWN